MTLVADIASANANSYLSVAEADAYAESDVGRHPAIWLGAKEDDKEAALITATTYIDGFRRWRIMPYQVGQRLVFPRITDVVSAAPYILENVKRACYEQAVYLLKNGQLVDDAHARHAKNLSSFQDDDGSGTISLSPTRNLMSPEATMFLSAIPAARLRGGRTLVSVALRSSFYDEQTP